MLRKHIVAAIAVVCAISAAQAQSLIQNGNFETWTAGLPNNWINVESVIVPTQRPGLDGTGSSLNLGLSGTNVNAAIRQPFSPGLGGSFYVQFDFAFANPGADRAMNATLKSGGSTAINTRVNAGQVEFYGSATGTGGMGWQVVAGTQGQMLASNFTTGTLVVYRLIIKGVWQQYYTASVTNLTTGVDLAVDVPVNLWQATATPFNELRLERGRSGADWRVDNVMVFANDPKIPVVNAGGNQQVMAPDNTVQMTPSVVDIDTAPEDLTYAWTQVSGPAASFSTAPGETAGDPQAVITLDGGPGVYEFKLTVSDPDDNTGEDTVLVRVKTASDSVLLGHWAFEDDPEGIIAADSLDVLMGNVAADDGILAALLPWSSDPNNDPNWVAGWVGDGALDFFDHSVVDIQQNTDADPNLLNLQWEISLAAWVKPDPRTLGRQCTIIVRGNPFNWTLRQIEPGTAEITLGLETGNLFTRGTVNLVDGYWHHVAGTYDGKDVKLYVDGVLDVSQPGGALMRVHPESEVTIGGRHDFAYSWFGLLDDVRVYSYALSPDDIQDLVLLGKNVIPSVAIDDTIPTELIIAFQDSVELTAQVTDLNTAQGQAVITTWSVEDASLADKVVFADASSANTTATFLEPGIYTLRLTVEDEFGAGAEGDIYDQITIFVKDAVCRDLLVLDPISGLLVNPHLPFDVTGPEGEPDCYVNLHDLAIMAQMWMLCNDPQGEGCQPIR